MTFPVTLALAPSNLRATSNCPSWHAIHKGDRPKWSSTSTLAFAHSNTTTASSKKNDESNRLSQRGNTLEQPTGYPPHNLYMVLWVGGFQSNHCLRKTSLFYHDHPFENSWFVPSKPELVGLEFLGTKKNNILDLNRWSFWSEVSVQCKLPSFGCTKNLGWWMVCRWATNPKIAVVSTAYQFSLLYIVCSSIVYTSRWIIILKKTLSTAYGE